MWGIILEVRAKLEAARIERRVDAKNTPAPVGGHALRFYQ